MKLQYLIVFIKFYEHKTKHFKTNLTSSFMNLTFHLTHSRAEKRRIMHKIFRFPLFASFRYCLFSNSTQRHAFLVTRLKKMKMYYFPQMGIICITVALTVVFPLRHDGPVCATTSILKYFDMLIL